MTRCRAWLAAVAAVVAVLSAGTALLPAGPAAAAVTAPGAAPGSGAPSAGSLRVSTRDLPSGVRGLYYLTALTAAGGTAPYAWSATRLPAGLRLSAGGLLTGYPLTVGPQYAAVRVRDARGRVALASLPVAVPASLPGGCVARSCALLAAGPRTVTVPARAIVSLSGPAAAGRAAGGQAQAGLAGRLVLRGGPDVTAGDILALAAVPAVPSGLVALAQAVNARDGETVITVRTATPADAFYQGTLQAQGSGSVTTGPASGRTGAAGSVPARTARVLRRAPSARARLSCADGVTSQLHGLDVSPSMTPTVAAQWGQAHYGLPVRGAVAARETPGSLRLFQFTMAGTITVNLGVRVPGPARCTMTLPAVVRAVPAGGLGAVVLRLRPTLDLVTTGALDVTTSVTLTCDAFYRLDAGTVTRADQCTAAHQPLRVSSLGGASASVSGAIAVSASLDGLNVVAGTASAALHAGYQPGGGTVAETDASAAFDLAAPLGVLWSGAPSVTVADGTAFSGVLSASARKPPRAAAPAVIAVTPAVAYPWSASVCGYGAPTFGRAGFTLAGHGFLPGERAAVSAGWSPYPRPAAAGPGGSFTVTSPVGEVPAVLGQVFRVAARGTAGSSAGATIKLDADGCLLQSGSGGHLAVRWGGNGFDAASVVSLSVDGDVVSSAATDGRGSGGMTAAVSCPVAGRYQWQVAGTVNGAPAAASGWASCASPRVSPAYPGPAGQLLYPPAGVRLMTGGPAVSAPVRQPWRVPPARPPLT